MNGISFAARVCWFATCIVGCLIQFQLCSATADDALETAVDALVEKYGFSADKPGLAILVVQPGKLRFEKGYGLARLEDRALVTPQTLFELAWPSGTKRCGPASC